MWISMFLDKKRADQQVRSEVKTVRPGHAPFHTAWKTARLPTNRPKRFTPGAMFGTDYLYLA